MKSQRINKKLLAYSLSAYSFIILNKTSDAQIIHFDINPDTILNEPDEIFNLDVDGDGEYDFLFGNYSFIIHHATSYAGFSWTDYYQAIIIRNLIDANAICGISSFVDTYSTGFTRYVPYALAINSSIGAFRSFQNEEFQAMIVQQLDYQSGEPFYTYGLWPLEVTDHFIGFQFWSIENTLHYGWIRCDVKEQGRELIIKDFAYESEPDKSICAGDEETVENISLEINIYGQNSIVYLSFNDAPEEPVRFTIYNITGQIVYKSTLVEQYNWLDHKLPNGNYIFTFESKEIDQKIKYTISS